MLILFDIEQQKPIRTASWADNLVIIETGNESTVTLSDEDMRREVLEHGDHVLPARDHCGRSSIVFGAEGQPMFVDVGILNELRPPLFD